MSQKPAPRLDLMPSACDRWFTCPASPRFCLENADLIPADLSSKFSQEGNTAHEVAAAFLQDREPNPENCPTPIDGAMRLHGWEYAEYVQSLADSPFSTLLVEQKQPLWYYEGRNAVVDAAVTNPTSLHIVDYKYGAGVAVSPVENRQTIIYAFQILRKLNVSPDFPVFAHIYQPRCRDNGGEPAHVWETTAGEIADLAGKISAQAQIILLNNQEPKGNPLPFVPSEKACRWCPAKGFCPARQAELLDGIEALDVIDEKPKSLPMPAALPIEQLAAVLKHKSNIEKWLKDAEEYALARLLDGHTIPGYKVVTGRGGNRYWTDEKQAAELLVKTTILKRAEVIEESTISVATAEKLIGKKKFGAELTALIGKAPGKPTVAPADDSRDDYLVKAENEFVALSDEQKDQLEDY